MGSSVSNQVRKWHVSVVSSRGMMKRADAWIVRIFHSTYILFNSALPNQGYQLFQISEKKINKLQRANPQI